MKKILFLVLVISLGAFAYGVAIGSPYTADCHPPVLDSHGNVVTPASDRWPCSENNPVW